MANERTDPPCIRCGDPIAAFIIESKAKIAGKLYPGRDVPPPKLRTRCVWKALTKFESDIDDGGKHECG